MKPIASYQQISYYLCLAIIILVSFFTVSPIYSGYFTSDNAIQILQANDFDFQKDLYYWGQKRLGGLVPMFGYLLHKATMVSPMYTTSIVNYILLILCYFIYSTFINSTKLKIGLALVLFLPAIHFSYIVLLGHPYGAQLLCIGIVLWYVQKWPELLKSALSIKSLILTIAFPLLIAATSVWLSEYSSVFLSFIFLNFILKNHKLIIGLPIIKLLKLTVTIVIPIFIGIKFILYAKLHADGYAYGNYPFWTELNTLKIVFTKTFIPFLNFLFFDSGNPLIPFVLTASIILFLTLSTYNYKHARNFMILTFLSIVPAIFSYWVVSNGWASRYFTPAYFFFWLTLFITIDKFKKNKLLFSVIAIILVTLQSIPILQFELTTKSESKRLSAFNQLGNCGIIGDYWASYQIEVSTSPSIIATSNGNTCRNYEHAYKVTKKESIYLIANNWFDVFPDTIRIFDVSLKKIAGSEQSIEEFRLAKYKK